MDEAIKFKIQLRMIITIMCYFAFGWMFGYLRNWIIPLILFGTGILAWLAFRKGF